MSTGKIVLLVIYAILAALAMTQGDTAVGVWALRLILLLVIVHTIEVLVFFKACREAWSGAQNLRWLHARRDPLCAFRASRSVPRR